MEKSKEVSEMKTHTGEDLERNKTFIRQHFEDFVNRQDSAAALRNMTADFLDHDEPYGESVGAEAAQKMMEAMYVKYPDLRVSVEDSIAEGDKVMVRNIWTGTDSATGKKIEFHGFVLWRLENGKIVERWATVTPPREVAA